MSTAYPGGIDNFGLKVPRQVIASADIDNLQDAVTAVETELGTNARGGSGSVSARIAAVEGRDSTKNVDYLVHVSGGTTYAINGGTGSIDYAASDSGALLQSVINALGDNGGTVHFKAGTYTWASVPALRPNLTNWIRIVGEPGVLINLSTAGSRFLDFGKQADNDTFRYIWLEGFTVNASALSSFNQTQHIVIGTYAAGNGTVSGQDVNFDHIVIRRIRTLAVPTSGTYDYLNIWIAIHATNNATQYTLKNVLVEQCELNGGSYGVALYGTRQSGFLLTADADIWEDNIVVRDIYHDTGISPTAFGSFAHVHVGSGAKGGTCWIERVYGRNSWDVGIEVDNFETAFVNDIRLDNYHGFGIAITNFVTVPNLKAQTYYLNNIVGHWTGSTGWSDNSSALIGMVQSNNGAGTPQTFGRVIVRGAKVFRSGASLDGPGLAGDLVQLELPMIEFLLDGGEYQATGLTHTTGAPSPTVIFTTPSSRTKLTLRNIDIRMEGTFGIGSPSLGVSALFLSGILDLLVENASVDLNFTNVAAFSEHAIDVGSVSGSNISGTIRGLRWSCNDTGGRGIVVFDAGNLTIPSALLIENCDFTRMASGGAEILYLDSTNQAKTWTQNNKWKTYPMAAYTLTTPTSATATRYTETWESTLLITGGTVSLVQVSRNGTAFLTVASGTNVAVPIQHTDYFKITYTVAPTITVLPRI